MYCRDPPLQADRRHYGLLSLSEETHSMTTQAGIPPTPEAISERQAIADILHLHCRALDRGDSAALQSCYWPDAEVDYGSYVGPAQDFAGLVVAALNDSYELTRHALSNMLIDLQEGRARCETYVNADHLLPGAELEMCFGGRYLDLLEKRGGQWRIKHRRVVMDWSKTRELEDLRSSDAFAEMSKGGHDSADPLHNFLAGAEDS